MIIRRKVDEIPAASDAETSELQEMLRLIAENRQNVVIYDRTTGVYAYWYFLLRGEEELARATRSGRPIAYLFLNARQEANAQVLGAALKFGLRISDLPAYEGGGRFVVLLPETPAEQAHVVVERLRGKIGDIFTSAVVGRPEDGVTFDELRQKAMEQIRRAGERIGRTAAA